MPKLTKARIQAARDVKLRPCPFCRGKDIKFEGETLYFFIACACGGQTFPIPDPIEAVNAWNRRNK